MNANDHSVRGTLQRFAFRCAGGALFLGGFVLVAVFAPMLVLVALGTLEPGLAAGPLEAVPSLAVLITVPLTGALLMALGVALRVRLGGSDDLARFRQKIQRDQAPK